MESEDELRATNAVLKLKLELEHDMKMDDTTELSPEIENQWLQNIYDFETLSKNSSPIKVYDLIGRPPFVPLNELPENDIERALMELELMLQAKGIVLDCCCKYDASIIYRFITEELFDHETQDIAMQGMIHHFCYEEFHPNHDYDIRRLVTDFVVSIIERKWNEQFDNQALAETISFNDHEYNSKGISEIITMFQETHSSCSLENFTIEEVKADVEKENGTVKANLIYLISSLHEKPITISGECYFKIAMQNDYWSISQFKLPGLGE